MPYLAAGSCKKKKKQSVEHQVKSLAELFLANPAILTA